MWALWIFGDNVEDRMGPLRFGIFYLTCDILAGITQSLTNPDSTVPSVGASGAIAGVLDAYLLFFPTAAGGAVSNFLFSLLLRGTGGLVPGILVL
jgi:membrane associated rhomboid family serine protease